MDDEVNRDKNGEADEINLEVDFKDEVMHAYLNERCVIFKEEMVGAKYTLSYRIVSYIDFIDDLSTAFSCTLCAVQ